MNNNVWDQEQTDSHATFEDSSHRGQGHDRILANNLTPGLSSPVAMASTKDEMGDVELTAGQNALSAVAGSLLTSLLMTPLDVVRVRLQSQPQESPLAAISKLAANSPRPFNSLPRNLGVTACCREVFFANNSSEFCMAVPRGAEVTGTECVVEETQRRTINSTFDGLRKIARNEGITSLWRGLSPTLAMAVPANIIYFTGYDWLRYNSKSPLSGLPENAAPLLIGGAARTMAAGVVSPIEMFRTRIQASRSADGAYFKETAVGIKEMVATHGYTSLWRGFSLTLWRDVPFSMLYWWGYEKGRIALMEARESRRGRSVESNRSRSRIRSRSQSRENHMATFADSFIAGAGSGTIATIVTMPFDVGKTRRQVFKDPGLIPDGPEKAMAPEEKPMLRFLWHIFKTEGVAGLWRGWIPRTMKVAPACAIMISSYEVLKKTFRNVNEKAERKRLGDV